MPKRDLFEELKQGLEDVRDFEQEKLTLRSTTIEKKDRKVLEAEEIRAIRDKYNMSRALFANFLHISTRTLEKWELGTSRPNEQATTLLALTDKYPDMFERLKTL
ncbi:helix-turn-helix domain-containing protein [bacterium]|nr:helix-turn-helix domain-containing protein [bacterium]MBU1958258.1 helix-turn-helix domain-containing protein [bacterium]